MTQLSATNESFYLSYGKRLFDLVCSLAGVFVLWPLMLILAILVVLESGWPAVYVQHRVGLGGRLFRLFKFRSMSVAKKEHDTQFEAGSTARVTKMGSILRKTKLDELLQLFNVIKGDMSLVGPRPEVQPWVDKFVQDWQVVHQIRPGITDEAAIVFRNEEEELAAAENPDQYYESVILPRKLAIYKSYVGQATFFGDLNLIFRTLARIIS